MSRDAWERTQERMADEQLGLDMFAQDKQSESPVTGARWVDDRYEVVITTDEGSQYVYGKHAYRNHAEAQRRQISKPGYFAPGTVTSVTVREVQE